MLVTSLGIETQYESTFDAVIICAPGASEKVPLNYCLLFVYFAFIICATFQILYFCRMHAIGDRSTL